MELLRLASPEEIAAAGAEFVAARAREACAARDRFVLALSGGTTPWEMLRRLAGRQLPWEKIHIVQVDERVAPDGHRDRNLTHIIEQFADRTGSPGPRLHAMPVTSANLAQGAEEYADVLRGIAGAPPVLDLVHLGLGSDGHTASLIPGDRLLDETEAEVGITGLYQGRARMTLTLPAINRSRSILWLIRGAQKAAMMERLIRGDRDIPAGRVTGAQATIMTDIPLAAIASRPRK